ncbi:MAG TPA: transposase, partial [Psychrobacter sp.]|uniref:transposase n=1 Tax=Psychrobacter sp. TaxID=56811 RepID=UPI002CAD96EF
MYLDESGLKSHDNRPYGYSNRGKKCFGQYNWQLKKQTNAIGAIYNSQLFAIGLYDRSVNSDVFHRWVEQKHKEWRLDCVNTLFFYFLWL